MLFAIPIDPSSSVIKIELLPLWSNISFPLGNNHAGVLSLQATRKHSE